MAVAPLNRRSLARDVELTRPEELRKLAAWYRDFVERAGNSAIWAARLRTAEELEADADRRDVQPPP
jgi:hypothetical protein